MDNEKKELNNSEEARKKSSAPKRMQRPGRKDKPAEEFEQKIVDLARVTRVMAGGKRMRFRACVCIGDRKGRVGLGIDKGADVTMAISKAVNKAKKAMVTVPFYNNTIPHEIFNKFGAGVVMLKPARKGRGVIAGGAARIILELCGVGNVTSKILGTNNNVTVAKCTIEALSKLRKVEKKKEVVVVSEKNEEVK